MPDAQKQLGPGERTADGVQQQQQQVHASGSTLALPAEGGADDGIGSSNGGRMLKTRKSALFYPSLTLAAQSNQKPFSKSAAKRESVLALGSIGHLQHLFSKQGIASKQRPQMAGNLTLAIGHAGESALQQLQDSPPSSPTLAGGRNDALAALEGRPASSLDHGSAASTSAQAQALQQPILVLPPSPTPPKNKRLPYPDVQRPTDVDPEVLLPDVIQALDETCQHWDLIGLLKAAYRPALSDAGHNSARGHGSTSDTLGPLVSTGSEGTAMERVLSAGQGRTVDVLQLITGTTKTIRRVRAYLLAVPADMLASRLAERAGSALTQTEAATLSSKTQKKNAFRRMSSYSQLPRAESRTNIAGGSSFGPAPTPALPNGVPTASATGAPSQNTSPVKRRPTREASESDARSSSGHGYEPSSTSPNSSPAKPKTLDDPLVVIRKSALDVLGMLRQLEERHRLPPDDPAYSSPGDGGSLPRRNSSAANLGPSIPPSRKGSTDGAYTFFASSQALQTDGSSAEEEDRDPDPTAGYLYRSGVRAEDLEDERAIVRNYVDTVDYVLSVILSERRNTVGFGRSRSRIGHGSEHGGSSRSSSALGVSHPFAASGVGISLDEASEDGLENICSDDEGNLGPRKVLQWNWPGRVAGGLKERLLILMEDLLPADLRPHLRSRGTDSDALLATLADGHLLGLTYNAALRRSRRPWGFLRAEDIHALVGDASTTEASKWTFRKIDNLRNWAAALRLRYSIAADDLTVVDLDRDWDEQGLVASGESSSSSSPHGNADTVAADPLASTPIGYALGKIRFEPRAVARQEGDWKPALSALIAAWLKALSNEALLAA
ncbi:hypothetical protein V8E36_009623 [Tilletia maclaganii]